MIEVEVYDNFNKNILLYRKSNTTFSKPLPRPKAIGVAIDYEFYVSGHDYTSTAVLSCSVQAGDMVQIKTNQKRREPRDFGGTKLSEYIEILYLVTAVDENNKATLQNYFYAMLENRQIPTSIYYNVWADYLNFMIWNIDDRDTNYIFHNIFYSKAFLDLPDNKRPLPKYGFKSESIDLTDVCRKLQNSFKFQVTASIDWITYTYDNTIDGVFYPAGIPIPFVGLDLGFSVGEPIETRIDATQNVINEDVIYIDRSNYNRVICYYKPEDPNNPGQPKEDSDYITTPLIYTLREDGTVIDPYTYNSPVHGLDLPSQVFTKTVFYDIKPTLAQVKTEINGDTILKKFTFDSNKLQPLTVNDPVKLWYAGKSYDGHICDMVLTENGVRLVFLESSSVVE